jgi:CRISPR/Cas system-associated exonuclease Cas4 (RecB family)
LEQGKADLSGEERFAFIGFNALSKCEKRLLQYMQQNCHTEFYWDYDQYYTDNKFQEAGMFIRENLSLFKQEEGISCNNLRNINSINVLSTSSNVAQCQCVVDILESIAAKSGGVLDKDTAVVLTDENLLMPLLYALPEKFKVKRGVKGERVVEKPVVNVTMGYPLRNTLVYSFVERLLELQKHARKDKTGEVTFYHVDVDGLLSHPFVADVSTSQYSNLRAEIITHRLFQVPSSMVATTPLLAQIFRKTEGWQELSEYLLSIIDAISFTNEEGEESAYRSEFLAVAYDALAKLQNIAAQCDIKITESVYRSLVRRHLQAERVSFTGEPLEGLQIMGILETRNLDFKNVILLSMTDNNFPGSRASDKSFLPYGLRYGFEIPTAEHHEGVYAYYFYRLIERAENLYMLYSSAADDKSTGEPSRYIRQIEYETDFKIDYTNVGVEVSLAESSNIEVEKSDEVFDKLLRFTRDKTLSPTAFSTYVKCPLKFYFNVVERLRPEDELEESIDNMTFGNIFHEAADYLYSQVKGDAEPSLRLMELRKRGEIERCVDKAIATIYFGDKSGVLSQELGGELLIIRNIVCEYLGSNLLNYDIRNNDFVVVETEGDLAMTMPIEVRGDKFEVHLAGRSDRIDSLNNGMMRVIDYKTGKPRLNYNGVEALFHGEPIATKRESNIINTLLYSMMLSHDRGRDVRPELYYVGAMVREDYSARFVETIERKSRTLDAYSEVAEEFEAKVVETLCEMFDRTISFKQCEDDSACRYCDYQTICNRK